MLFCSEFTTHSDSPLKRVEKSLLKILVIHYIFSSELLRAVNSESPQIVNSLRILFLVCGGRLGTCLFAIFPTNPLLRSLRPFCTFWRTCVRALLRTFALFCGFLRPTAFRTTAIETGDGNCRKVVVGNGRKTVSSVLFRQRGLIDFCGKLGEFCENSVTLLWRTDNGLGGTY